MSAKRPAKPDQSPVDDKQPAKRRRRRVAAVPVEPAAPAWTLADVHPTLRRYLHDQRVSAGQIVVQSPTSVLIRR